MLGAVILSGLALAGASSSLWVSSTPPREDTRYRAMTWRGGGEFECGASIGTTFTSRKRPAEMLVYRSPTHTVCVVVIPKGTAGLKLWLSYTSTQRRGSSVSHADGLLKPKLIRR